MWHSPMESSRGPEGYFKAEDMDARQKKPFLHQKVPAPASGYLSVLV